MSIRKADRGAHARHALRINPETARDDLRIGVDLVQRVDGAGGHTGAFAGGKQGLLGEGPCARAQPCAQCAAPRDALGRDARASLPGTAALLELARITGAGRLQRAITFISTTGSTTGNAGAIEAARTIAGGDVEAVLVLGSLAAAERKAPMVVTTSTGIGQTPLELKRTVEAALAAEGSILPAFARALGRDELFDGLDLRLNRRGEEVGA